MDLSLGYHKSEIEANSSPIKARSLFCYFLSLKGIKETPNEESLIKLPLMNTVSRSIESSKIPY